MSGHSDSEKEEPADAEPGIAKAFAATDEFLRDQSQRMACISRELELSDYTSNMNAALKKGREEGKGEVVTNMLNMGFDISSISKASGWPAEQILAFALEHNLTVKQ